MKADEIRETFRYHKPSPAKVRQHQAIRNVLTEAAVEIGELTPFSRERSLALTALQEAQMWANAAVAIHGTQPQAAQPSPRPQPEAAGDPDRTVLPVDPGLIHRATTGRPDYRREFSWPPNEKAAEISVTVIPGEINPGGAQLLWWCMPRHRNLLALALVRNDTLILRTDVGVAHGDKQRRVRRPHRNWFCPGRAYRVRCRYELGGTVRFRLVELEMDELLVSIDTPANVDTWPKAMMVLGLGYPRFDDPAVQAHHPIQPGWEWRDLEITS